jgi:hypothetical protein
MLFWQVDAVTSQLTCTTNRTRALLSGEGRRAAETAVLACLDSLTMTAAGAARMEERA